MSPLLRSDGAGALLDSMIEKNFARLLPRALQEGRIPYRTPWVGMVHVPPAIPDWFDTEKSFARICRQPAWQESWPYCRGLFTLSRTMREWLAGQVDVPVCALRHPTEIPDVRFDWDRYRQQGQRVVQVGWWLRNLTAIYRLPIPVSRKVLLVPQTGENLPRFAAVLEADRLHHGAPPPAQWGVPIVPHLSNRDYDELLSGSLVFLNLYGAVANNAILDCIARATPVLVNGLPSVREYLGEDYPLYYETMEEAAEKALDPCAVQAAHAYLRDKDKSGLSAEAFCRDMAESEIYRALP